MTLSRIRTFTLGVACLVGAALASLSACTDAQEPSASAPPARAAAIAVKTLPVSVQALERELLAVGSLRSSESVMIRPEIAGRIVRIGFDEGQAVTRGQRLFELDDSIDRAQLEQARASHALAQRSAQRAEELYARKLASAADRDQAVASLALATADLAVAQARLDKTVIVAPFTGIAGLRRVSPGDYVVAGQDLAGLEAVDTMKLDFRIDQSDLAALSVGQKLEFSVDAFPGERFAGEVYAIEPRIAETTRAIALRASIPNPEGRLRPGQFARIRLVLERLDDAIVIPERALFPRGAQQFVYVDVDGHAQLREVRIGQRLVGQVEIVSGLTAGETLIVSGLQQLSDGAMTSASAYEPRPSR
jgi:membrane fusion protein (multidrug efflux system)